MNSCILSFFASCLHKLYAWLCKKAKTSLLCTIFLKIAAWFDNAFKKSFIIKGVSKAENTDRKHQKYANISKKIRFGLTNLLYPISRSVQKSWLIDKLYTFTTAFYDYGLRAYGIFFSIFGAGCIASCLMRGHHEIWLVLSIVLLCAGLFLCLIKESVSEILESSFCVNILGIHAVGARENVVYKTPVVLGCMAAVLALLINAPMSMLCVAGIILAAMVFQYTEFALIAYIVVLPFMPTMVMVAGVLGLCAVFLAKTYLMDTGFTFRYSSLNLIMLIMAGVFVWGVINSYEKLSSTKSVLVYLAFMLSYYLIVNLLSNKKILVNAFRWITVASVPCALMGIYQYLNPEELTAWIDAEMFEDIAGRIVSFFENPNVYGEYLILIIMINFGVILYEKRIFAKFLYCLPLALNTLCIILTYSRGCWIGIAAAMLILLFIQYRKWFMGALFAGGVSIFFLPQNVLTRLLSIGNLADSSTSYRMYIWEGTIQMLKDFWVSGIGVGSDAFNHIYPIYAYGAITAPHAHNLYLVILSETGIVGLFVFAALILLLLKKLFVVSQHSQNRFCKIFSGVLFAGLIGFLIQGVFDNVWYNYRVFLLFFMMVGMGAALCEINKEVQHD